MSVDALERGLQELSKPYRVRMVAAGLSSNQESLFLVTAMGGGSIGSQNRRYVEHDSLVSTVVYDPTLPSGDPDKTIYVAHACMGRHHVASNGHQTEDIAYRRMVDIAFPGTLVEWEHEGKAAANTSRIVVEVSELSETANFGRISANQINPELSDRTHYPVRLINGSGYFISTYRGDGTTAPSLEHPHPLPFLDHLEANVDRFWDLMDPNTTTAMVGKVVNRETGDFRYYFRDRAKEFAAKYRASLPGSV